MVVWGGSVLNTGGRYDPAVDIWKPTSTTNAPEGRLWHTAIWTSTEMVVWGGYNGAGCCASVLNTGGRYDLATDTWTPVSMGNAPAPRRQHTAVWTGSRMVVWGGSSVFSALNTGGLYDPMTDSWTSMSETDAPPARAEHSAVWTGSVMVVWGGANPTNLNTGGRYDPTADIWTPTTTGNAPAGRYAHTAVWTGGLMIVWGGVGGSNSGARYDPIADSWTAMSGTGAPMPRYRHTVVWTGEFMIVWGGLGATDFNDGGRYCACSEAVYYQDGDGDGYGDPVVTVLSCRQPAGFVVTGTDCNDAAAGVWGIPTEVQDLHFSDQATLTWAPPADPGAASIVYDAIRSEEAADFVIGSVCVSTDGPDASVADPEVPLVGRGFYYLVRAQNACPGGEGSLGANSSGTPRSARSCP
jgi:energy-converting hydrogenase Eha subunit E